jgi:hypothetical protein
LKRALLRKSFRFFLIISQFTPTSIFLPFQGLVASQKNRFHNVKAQLSLFNRIIFTKQRLFQAVITKYKGVPKLSFDTPFPKYYNLTAMLHKALSRVKQ